MSTRRLVFWITILAVFAMAARVAMDTDTWWHLRTGQWIVERRAVPHTDPFSYTRLGHRWEYASAGWPVEVLLYWIYRGLGPGGLVLWLAGMVALAYAFLWQALSGGEFLRAFVVVLSATVAAVYWAARPYMATFVFMAASLWILEDFRWCRADRLWWLPLLMLVWANSHGGFAVGFVLWGLYGLAEGIAWLDSARQGETPLHLRLTGDWLREGLRGRVGRMSLIGVLMLAAACLNPSGPAVLLYPFETVSIGALQDLIDEWQSPDFHDLIVQPFVWLLLLTFGAVGASRKRLAFTDFALFAAFAYMGLVARRNLPLFALVAPLALTRHAGAVAEGLRERLGLRPLLGGEVGLRRPWRILNWGLLVLVGLAVALKVSLVYPREFHEEVFKDHYPVGAVDYIRSERPEGRLLNSYNWGGYLLWALPEYPVFVDGRTDLYGDEIIGEWLTFVGAEQGWREIADKWDVRLVLLEPHWPVVRALESEGWQLLYSDSVSVLYGR